jgi:hypothetical protein
VNAHVAITLKDLPDWPAALDVQEALAYSRLSESEMRRRVAKGEIVFKPVGPNGKKVCLREQLDVLLKSIWSDRTGAPPTPMEDLDFGDG